MNALDANLQSFAPTLMVPRHEPLPTIRPDSHRYLAAEDGFYIEVDRPWVHGIFKISESTVSLPYGELAPCFDLRIDGASLALWLHEFIKKARFDSPLEAAAWLLYSPSSQSITGLHLPTILSRSRGHIRYIRPNFSLTEHPIIDAHSHGAFTAFFSNLDDADDLKDDLKIAFVAGNLDQPKISVAARLVGLGLNISFSERVASLLQNEGVSISKESNEGRPRLQALSS